MRHLYFPKHYVALFLSHNEHKTTYQTVADAIRASDHGYVHWVSPEQKQKAIETNDCWVLQWYPDSPVAFQIYAAADLEALLEYVNEDE